MKFRWFKLVFFDLPFILFILLFIYVTISYLPGTDTSMNVFLHYITALVPFSWIPLVVFALFLGGFIFINQNKPVRNKVQRTTKYAFGLLLMIFIAVPLAFAAVYVYAFAQINYRIITYNTGSTANQFMTAPQAIADAIAATDKLSLVPTTEATYKKDLLLLSMKQKDGFYEERILPAFPMVLYKRSYMPLTQMTFVNNHLVINEVTADQLAIISPALGKYLIEHTTQKSLTKAMPQVEILEKPLYVAVRKKHINKQVSQINDAIKTVESNIASISGFIATNQESIESNNTLLTDATKQKETVKCKTPEQCISKQAKWDKTVKIADSNISKAQLAMQKNQEVLGTTMQNKENLEQVKNELAAVGTFTDKELGMFTEENKIIMTLDRPDTPEGFNKYLHTLIHEYFHYLSYVDEGSKLDPFFEEALTEHFARFVYKNYTGQESDFGYSIGVRIIEEMLKKIPERQLAEVYFSKDQKTLELLLNKVYGSSFYQDNATAFKMINYLPFEESVQLANLIMAQIGGKPLEISASTNSRSISIPSHDPINENSVENSKSTLVLPE